MTNTWEAAAVNTAGGEDDGNKGAARASADAAARRIAVRDNRIDSGDLFCGGREIAIVHGGDTYRLRLTAQNKLILTK